MSGEEEMRIRIQEQEKKIVSLERRDELFTQLRIHSDNEQVFFDRHSDDDKMILFDIFKKTRMSHNFSILKFLCETRNEEIFILMWPQVFNGHIMSVETLGLLLTYDIPCKVKLISEKIKEFLDMNSGGGHRLRKEGLQHRRLKEIYEYLKRNEKFAVKEGEEALQLLEARLSTIENQSAPIWIPFEQAVEYYQAGTKLCYYAPNRGKDKGNVCCATATGEYRIGGNLLISEFKFSNARCTCHLHSPGSFEIQLEAFKQGKAIKGDATSSSATPF